jgi:hypothetical protein
VSRCAHPHPPALGDDQPSLAARRSRTDAAGKKTREGRACVHVSGRQQAGGHGRAQRGSRKRGCVGVTHLKFLLLTVKLHGVVGAVRGDACVSAVNR